MRLIPLILMTMLIAAACPAQATGDAIRLNTVLERLGVHTAPEELTPAPIPGFLEIARGTRVLYVSKDGGILIDGDILSIGSERNLTEERRAAIRREMLAAIPKQSRLVLPATAPTTARITVFTDTNCPYCLALHRQHRALRAQGIEIQYLFYPRSGPEGESWAESVSVWCDPDRENALDAVLRGRPVRPTRCDNPVRSHYELAKRLGLKGTPAIITADGAVYYGMTSVPDVLDAVGRSLN